MPNINSSLLALSRKRLGYEQKQIALLLGHKNTFQISRYETGQRVPGFKEAVKLSLLYGLPLRVLFSRYFRRSLEELENAINQTGLSAKINPQQHRGIDYCSYLDALSSDRLSEEDADKMSYPQKRDQSKVEIPGFSGADRALRSASDFPAPNAVGNDYTLL